MLQKFTFLISLFLVLLLSTTRSIAQTVPDGVIFQAVATDPQGNPASGRTIYIKATILQSTATGNEVYSESFKITASSAGVFTVVIGKGQNISGPASIASLDWSAGPYFLNIKSAVEPSIPLANWDVNQQYVDMGTSQFWSVPFALYASKVAGLDLKMNIADTTNMLKAYLRKSDTASISNRINLKLNTLDTSSMLSPYQRSAAAIKNSDTASMLSNYLRKGNVANTDSSVYTSRARTQKAVDSIGLIKINVSDTANMLSHYANVNAIPVITGKVNSSDTASMLTNYLRKGNVANTDSSVYASRARVQKAVDSIGLIKINASDTASMLSHYANVNAIPSITGKVNSSDTASMLSHYANVNAIPVITGKVNSSDTASMLTNYRVGVNTLNASVATKINAADTAGMLSHYANVNSIPSITGKLNNTDTTAMLSTYLANRFTKVNYSDTASMLSNYLRVGNIGNTDSSVYASRARVQKAVDSMAVVKINVSDTASMLSHYANVNSIGSTTGKVNYTDTAAMLSPYLSNRFLKLNTSDTTAMLSNYLTSINSLNTGIAAKVNSTDTASMLSNRFARDTVALSNRINLKLNLADTASMLSNYAKTTNVTNSLVYKLNISDTANMLSPYYRSDYAAAALALKFDANKVGVANGVPNLDGGGKVPSAQLPALSFTGVNVKASDSAMLALGLISVKGAVCVRTDNSNTYILSVDNNPNGDADWIQLLTPGAPVQSVNGQIGTISLTTTNIAEGSNLYYTDARAVTANAGVAATKENTANKSTDTNLGTSNTLFPSQYAVKSYVDAQVTGSVTPDASNSIKGKIQLAGDLGGAGSSASAPVITDAAITTGKLADNAVTTAKLIDASVTDAKITAVSASKISGNIAGNAGNITGIAAIVNGGTGAATASAARSNLGLDQINNTSDFDKSVSFATQTALDLKAPIASPTFTGTVSGITKTMIGLSNADNTSDANKPVSTATQTALSLKEDISNKSTNIASDATSDTKYPSVKAIKTYVDAQTAAAGVADGSIITAKLADAAVTTVKLADANVTDAKIVTVSGSKLTGTVAIVNGGTGATNASSALTNLGLDQINNTSDLNKPVSTATQTALNLKLNYTDTGRSTSNITTAGTLLKLRDSLQANINAITGSTNIGSDFAQTSGTRRVILTSNTGTGSSFVLPHDSLSITGTSLSINNSNAVALPSATASTSGILSSTDWNSFSGKQAALTAGTGIAITGNTISIPQSIASSSTPTFGGLSLSNLSTKGIVTNSGAGVLGTTNGTGIIKNDGNGNISYDNNVYVNSNLIGAVNGVASLGSNGLIPSNQIPAISFSTVTVVGSQSAMLAISGVVGSTAVRTDLNETFILSSLPASVLSNWTQLLTPGAPVQTVNGATGVVVLTTDNVNQGSNNKYFSNTLAQNAISLTTGTSSGAASYVSGVLNIPNYTLAGLGGLSLSSISATSPVLYNNTTGEISSQAATTAQSGYLTATDWNSFNSRQSALSFSTGLTNTTGTITVNPSQNIATLSNLTGNGLIKTSGGTGALSIATAGTDYLAPFASQTSNYVFAAPNGASGTPSFRSLQAADISNATTVGQNFVKLTNPSAISFPQINADNSISALSASAYRTAIGVGTFSLPSLTAGSVLFSDGSTIAQSNSKLFWDNTNNRLGIGTSAPSFPVHILMGTSGSQEIPAQFEGTETNGGGVVVVVKNNNTTTNSFSGFQMQAGDNNHGGMFFASRTALYNYGIGNGISFRADPGQDIVLSAASSFGSQTVPAFLLQGSNGKIGIQNASPSALLTLGTAGTTAGTLSMAGATSGTQTIQVPSVANTLTWTLPGSQVTNGVWVDNGSGVLTNTALSSLASNAAFTGAYVPYSGAAAAVNLGAYDLTVNTLTVGLGQSGISTNTVLGNSALLNNTTGSLNAAIGPFAMNANTTGFNNIAIGYHSLMLNTTGHDNTGNGVYSLAQNLTGNLNTANGGGALYSNTTGSNNTASGQASLNNNTTGSNNTASGSSSLLTNTTGGSNTAIGAYSLQSNTTGGSNTATGYQSLYRSSTGSSNTGYGYFTLFGNTTGSNNTALGDAALATNTTGINNTALGFGADVVSVALSNATAIGFNASVAASNSIQLGNTSVNSVVTSGKITTGTITLPNTDGTSGQVLSTNGSGVVGWTNNGATGNQTANFVYAAPNGSTGTPSFRALVATDIPSLSSTYLPLSAGSSNPLTAVLYMPETSSYNINQGLSWSQGAPTSYGIYRTSGAWSAPNFAQLEMAFATGIVIDGGSSYGKSGTSIQPNGGATSFGGTINLATGTASKAALQFTTGVNLSTPVSGAIEYDGTNLYYTNSSAARQTLATTANAAAVREVADEFTATAAQTIFTLTQTKSANSKVKMYINGIRISNTAYSVSGTALTYTPANNGSYALVLSDRIQFDYYY